MKKKTSNFKSTNKNTIQGMKKNESRKKKLSTTEYKVKSPCKSSKNKKQKSNLSIKISTPPLVSRISKTPLKKEDLYRQQYVNNQRLDRITQVQIPSESNIKTQKLISENNYNQKDSDYSQLFGQKHKVQSNWSNSNKTSSTVNEQICHEYGYSNLSHAMIKSQKNHRDSLKKHKHKSQKQDMQRLMAKYRKHIDRDDSSRGSSTKSKDKNFRTLSTDDKSQKKLHFTKSTKNTKNSKVKKILSKFPQKINKCSQKKNKCPSKNKISPNKKKSKSKTLLPDYFGCLSINKVESQLETLKSKQEKLKNKIKPHIDSNQTTTDRFKKDSVKNNKVFSARSSYSSNFLTTQSKNVSPFKKKTQNHLVFNNMKSLSQRSSKKS